ncbi:MAG: autotransporter-associated beta strand repeat-containing protein, partial [Moraxellaceae bacterium]|nr:autotransporter-associated beta strand repeat-containing protein [Moraxellaceae bacterium]
MRHSPFIVRPLALSVALSLVAPVALALDTPIITSSSTTITDALNVVQGAGTVTTTNDTNITQVTGAVSGTGELVKQGEGTLSLTADNAYKGGTSIEEGTLSIKRAASLGTGDVKIANDATLETQKSTAANKTTTLTQNISLSGSATISTNDAENITQITSTVSGAGSLTKAGAGTLSLTADNSFGAGTTTIIEEGTLAISRTGSLGASTKIDIKDGATLKTNQDVADIKQNVNIIGQGKIDTGGKNIALDGKVIDGTNSTLTGQVTGGTLVKIGSGSLTLANTTNDQSNTVISGGILIINDKSNLGTSNGNVTISSGTLQTNADMSLENTIITSGSAGGSINTGGHDVELAGQVTGAGRLVKTGGGTLTLTQANDYNISTALDKDGNIVATVGNTVINGGVLAISNDNQLGISAQDLGVKTAKDDQYKWELGNVKIDGGTLKTNNSVDSDRFVYIGAAGATVDVSGAANTTVLAGNIKNVGVAGGLTKEGEGTLKIGLDLTNYKEDDKFVITANNDLKKVTIKAGVLEVNSTERDFGTKTINVNLAGGELRVNGDSDIGAVSLTGNGGAIDTTGATITAGVISGDGNIQKKGSGTLVLNASNTHKGNTTISEGKVQISSAAGLGAGTNGKLVLDGGSLQVVSGAAIDLAKDAVITSNNGTVDTTDNNVTLLGAVSGAGQLIKSGSGTFKLANEANTFEGGVRIKEGTLEVNGDGALGKADTQVILDGATLAITKNTELQRQIILTEKGGTVAVTEGEATLKGKLTLDSGAYSADFTKAGAGVLNLTQNNTNGSFKGNTTIKEGTLGITNQDNLAEGKLFLEGGNLRTNESLTFNKEIIINTKGGIDTANNDVTVSSKIQGNGAFVKVGEGSLTLSADNSYAGGTQITGGALVVNNDKNLGLQATDITLNGGTLQLGAADAVSFKNGDATSRLLKVGQEGGGLDVGAFDLTIETDIKGDGTLTQKGTKDGVLTLAGDNTALKGGVTVESGTLKIDANKNLGATGAQLTLKDGTTLDTTAANTKLVLEHSITVGDGKATLKQDEDL